MSGFYCTDDPLKDADRYDRENSAWLRERPVCDSCGEPIQENYCYTVFGARYCKHCQKEAWDAVRYEYKEALPDG